LKLPGMLSRNFKEEERGEKRESVISCSYQVSSRVSKRKRKEGNCLADFMYVSQGSQRGRGKREETQ
jgi:hypothetical protein